MVSPASGNLWCSGMTRRSWKWCGGLTHASQPSYGRNRYYERIDSQMEDFPGISHWRRLDQHITLVGCMMIGCHGWHGLACPMHGCQHMLSLSHSRSGWQGLPFRRTPENRSPVYCKSIPGSSHRVESIDMFHNAAIPWPSHPMVRSSYSCSVAATTTTSRLLVVVVVDFSRVVV
jgi:hypothetical protein